jgi:decaprenylphospho-beta-D-ribofuranose 2-oxidase
VSPPSRAHLWGWGRTNATVADEVTIDATGLAATLKEAGRRGALARGLGRSYGDAAQNGGGLVVRLASGAGDIVLDPSAGVVTAGAGVSIDELLRVIVPQGFFIPVTPGTRFVTIGGAIASDIHGKNHHVDGSIGNYVASITMMLADGSTTVIGPGRNPTLFWATVGGMGLTGIMLDATITLLPIETSRMRVDTTRIADLDTLLATMTDGDEDVRYSVAWIDLVAKGRNLGRSVLTRGDHAHLADLDAAQSVSPFAYGPHQLIAVPPVVPPMGVVNHATIAAFNEFWFRKAPSHRTGEIQGIGAFFHPLDLVGSWNRLYGSRGMVQYQFVVPFGAEEAMRTVVERFSASGAASFLAVLKRFGAANPAPLSFPQAGWTLALDLPGGTRGLADLLYGLDRVVLDAGGRHYFAKDAHMTPAAVRRGYPRLDEWKAIRDKADPRGLWQSDLGRRLGLI